MLRKIKVVLFIMLFLGFGTKEVFWDYKVFDKKVDKISYEKLSIKWVKKPPFKLYSSLKDECTKQKARNIKHCIKTWISLNYAESSFKTLDLWLKSKDTSIKYWVKQYNKYWYKSKNWHFFYWDKNEIWKSNYCVTEHSSWSKKWCPNWKINFEKIYFNLHF